MNKAKRFAGFVFALALVAGMLLPTTLVLAQAGAGGTTPGAPTGAGGGGTSSGAGGTTPGTPSGAGGTQGPRPAVGVLAPIKFESVTKLIQAIMEGVKNVGFLIGFVGIIYSGFLFVKAQGKPEELKVARAAFTWTIVGVFIILGAEVLVDVIINTLFKDAS